MNTEAKQDFIRWKARQNKVDPEGAKSKITRPGIAHFLIAWSWAGWQRGSRSTL